MGNEDAPKDAKTKVKEAIENIHMPKLPKIHKPAFLKKKKEGEEGEEVIEKDDEKKDGEDEEKDAPEEKKDGDAEEEEKDKKSKIIDSLKNIKSQVHVPAFLKKGSKEKDVETGDKEESKELLEKKEGQEEGADENKDKEEGEATEEKSPEDEEKTADQADGKATSSRGTALLESIRSVASQVPFLFKKSKAKETDVEAGEKDELLDKQEDTNKKEGEEGDDLKEVKIDESGSPVKKDPDAASHDSEKKDPEKG